MNSGSGASNTVRERLGRDKNRDCYAPRPDDAPAITDWRERLGSQAAKDIYKKRAATAECTNAQTRNRGLRQFLVRGVCKVKSIALFAWPDPQRMA